MYEGIDKKNANNYRLIAVLSIISKIYETIINVRIMNFIIQSEGFDFAIWASGGSKQHGSNLSSSDLVYFWLSRPAAICFLFLRHKKRAIFFLFHRYKKKFDTVQPNWTLGIFKNVDKNSIDLVIIINRAKLERVIQIKCLGVQIDEDLPWNDNFKKMNYKPKNHMTKTV